MLFPKYFEAFWWRRECEVMKVRGSHPTPHGGGPVQASAASRAGLRLVPFTPPAAGGQDGAKRQADGSQLAQPGRAHKPARSVPKE